MESFLILLFLVVSPAARISTAASPLFILGDSSASCGDNAFFPRPMENSSRVLCDGNGTSRHRLLPDLIAERMGLPPVPPSCRANETANGMKNGLNFATVPATILSGGHSSFSSVQSLSSQIRKLYDAFQLLQLQTGAAAFDEILSSAVFYVSFGRDDFIDLFFLDSSELIPKYGRRGFPAILVSQMLQSIEGLYHAGARKIVVVGVLPLGCTPRVMWEAMDGEGLDERGCVREVNELCIDYNARLTEGLEGLNARLGDAELVFCDIYAGMMEIIANPAAYGFADEKRACCGLGGFGGMVGCLTAEMACEEPRKRVWWDLYNPTARVNELLVNWSWTGVPPSICRPRSLRELVSSSSPLD
ncbi:GDSL esterase/lipase At1g71691-like isoform X2 [Wolffia australiana]